MPWHNLLLILRSILLDFPIKGKTVVHLYNEELEYEFQEENEIKKEEFKISNNNFNSQPFITSGILLFYFYRSS